MEDVVSVTCLATRTLPRLCVPHVDPRLADLNLAVDGGACDDRDVAVHLAAGLGSHVAVVVYGRM